MGPEGITSGAFMLVRLRFWGSLRYDHIADEIPYSIPLEPCETPITTMQTPKLVGLSK